MCGIAGYFGFNNENLLKKFSQQLAHRGPDGEGYFFDDKVGLLNRRLAIIDLNGGDQPIYNEDRSVVVVYNGEIYNYRELRRELERKGHKFKTQSDTEVIVHLYEEEQEACFDRFNGMFAVALYDIRKKKLVLARDHFGIKPLYYVKIPSTSATCQIVFASEIKPLFYSGLIEKKPNDHTIYRYLRFRVHDDNEETFFKGIKRIMPGELMIAQSSEFNPSTSSGLTLSKARYRLAPGKVERVRVQSYTNLKQGLLKNAKACNVQSFNKLDMNKIEEFKSELIRAIRYRLISDVPVGTCLSGGLDSSTVVAVVNKLLKEKAKEAQSVGKIQKSFSAIFPGSSNDEEKYIENLKSQISNLKSYKICPKPEGFFEEIEDFVKTQEEPTISTGPYAQFKVMEEASKYVKVLLDGQGADEMLAGYLPYYFVYLKQIWKDRSFWLFGDIRVIREIWGARDIATNYFWQWILLFLRIKQLVKEDKLINKNFGEKFKTEKFLVTDDDLKKRLIEDIFKNSLPALLRYEDRNSMRFSIEGRVPFLDFNLLKLIFSLPSEFIIKNGWNKYLLREAIKDIVPETIRERRDKIGFTTPEQEWFIRMKNRIYGIFLSESFAKRLYFNRQEVLKAFQKFIEGKNDDTMIFWRLLNLEMWLRLFFDKDYKSHKCYKSYNRKQKCLEPNEGKKLEIEVGGKTYLRFPVKTDLFQKGDNVIQKITKHTLQYINIMKSRSKYNKLLQKKWFIVVSEKIIAIAQGRSHFIWEIKPDFWAKFLSKHVTKTPWGIGLGSPWTMQLAINEVGLWKILLAAFVTVITKPFGIRGLFYRIAGKETASIDGPTEYSLYPSNVSAKLGPKKPENVAEKISLSLRALAKQSQKEIASSPSAPRDDRWMQNFLGTVIIDANDLGQNVLANTTTLDNHLIESIFKDNPMGQADEQTPLVIVFER